MGTALWLRSVGFSLQWLLLLQSRGCGVWAQQLQFLALEHQLGSWVLELPCYVACGIFPDRDQTRVPWIGRQILSHRPSQSSLLTMEVTLTSVEQLTK